MTSFAYTVQQLLAANEPSAVTLEGGYMLCRDGRRILFSDHYGDGSWDVPRTIATTRNAEGRCTMQKVQYSDGSMLVYQWSLRRGARWTMPAITLKA